MKIFGKKLAFSLRRASEPEHRHVDRRASLPFMIGYGDMVYVKDEVEHFMLSYRGKIVSRPNDEGKVGVKWTWNADSISFIHWRFLNKAIFARDDK